MKIIDIINDTIFNRPALSVKIFGPGNYTILDDVRKGDRHLYPGDRKKIKEFFKKEYGIIIFYDKTETDRKLTPYRKHRS